MIHSRLVLAGTIVAGLLAAGNAYAGAIASSQMSGLQIMLSDLGNPSAGPQVFEFSGISYASVYADPLRGYPFRPSPDPATYQYVSNGPLPGTLPASAVTVSQAKLSGTSLAASQSLVATANAIDGMVSSVTGAHAAVREPIDQQLGPYEVILAANTALTLSAWASVFAQSDGQSLGPTYWENSHSAAYAALSFDSPDGPFQRLTDALNVETAAPGPQTLSDERLLTLTYANESDHDIHLLFDWQTAANATAVVPEPSSSALTFLGLGAAVTSLSLKRRRRT